MHEHDLVIRGGTIVDGTGIPQYRADLAVKDGRIAMISARIPAATLRRVRMNGFERCVTSRESSVESVPARRSSR